MAGCGNCAYTKKYLKEKNIAYTEHPVSEKQNEEKMLKHLQQVGDLSSVVMPVIILNDTLVHPVIHTDTGYKRMDFDNALEYIVRKVKRENVSKGDENKVDHYLVCGEFNTMAGATHFIKVLELEGYKSAGYYEQTGVYYVYAMCTSDIEAAKRGFEELRTKYRGTHVVSF